MPAVRTAKPILSQANPGLCANPQSYAAEPWVTSVNVTMSATATTEQVDAVAQKIGGASGSTIVVDAGSGVAPVTLTLPADPNTPLPVSDARRVAAVPGVTSVHTGIGTAQPASGVNVEVDQLSAIQQVDAAVRAAHGFSGALSIDDGSRLALRMVSADQPPPDLDAVIALAQQHPKAKFTLFGDLAVHAADKADAEAIADALDAAGIISGQLPLSYEVTYGTTVVSTLRTGIVGAGNQ
jgi:hypothetical protein